MRVLTPPKVLHPLEEGQRKQDGFFGGGGFTVAAVVSPRQALSEAEAARSGAEGEHFLYEEIPQTSGPGDPNPPAYRQ